MPLLSRDICRRSNTFYEYKPSENIWKETHKTFPYRTSVLELGKKFDFNMKNRLITFNNSHNCIDVDNGLYREIQREDYLNMKSENIYVETSISEKEIIPLFNKFMVKRDIETIISDFEEIFFKMKDKILCFPNKAMPICRFLHEYFDDYCMHGRIYGSPDGRRTLKIDIYSKFKPIFLLIQIYSKKDFEAIVKCFRKMQRANKPLTLLLYFEKIDTSFITETSEISVYRGRKVSSKLRKEGYGEDNNGVGALFLKYLIKKIWMVDGK